VSRIIIVAPYVLASIAPSRGSGGSNLKTPDPREAWFDTATSEMTIAIDLGTVRAIDTVFLGYTNAGSSAAWSISCGVAAPNESSFLAERGMIASTKAPSGRRHALAWRDEPIDARYLTLTIEKGSGDPLWAGVLVVGSAFQPSKSHELGSGRWVGDTGTRERTKAGGFAVDEGVATSGWQWTLGDLTDAEVDQLYQIARDRRQTRSVLVVEQPDYTTGQPERCHWGMFDRLEPYDRRVAGMTRWGFRIEEWG
jgi:hypothetical protein